MAKPANKAWNSSNGSGPLNKKPWNEWQPRRARKSGCPSVSTPSAITDKPIALLKENNALRNGAAAGIDEDVPDKFLVNHPNEALAVLVNLPHREVG